MANILVVEDNRHIREITVLALEKGGYRVYQAQDGEQARLLLHTHPFDLLITDVMLPGVTGLELIPLARQRNAATKVIVLSAVAEETKISADEMRTKLEVDGYLSKPCTIAALLDTVRNVLALKKK